MSEPTFVITDDEGNPEGITNPIEEVIEDPKPAPKPRSKRIPRSVPKEPVADPKPAPKIGRPSKSDLEREVAGELQALLMLGSMLWTQIDQECGPVLNTQSKAIGDALAAVLANNPRLLAKFKDATGMGDYIKLAVAIMPVAKAISAHHIQPGLKKRAEVNGQL